MHWSACVSCSSWIAATMHAWTVPVLHAVYFVQGILGLSRLAVSFFYKDELHIDPAEVRGRPARSRQCVPGYL